MLLAEAGCVFTCFILYISGVNGRTKSICALRGSSVDLPCSAERPTSSMKWFTLQWNGSDFVQTEISADGHRVTYNMSEKSQPPLTIRDVRESDANIYCCRENTDAPELCRSSETELQVADLQVKVLPATEEQTVTLMCNTSCPLTENPATFIWYKNGKLLYQDWSNWYQELVGSEEAATYSCAVKGYEDLRAPEVSVDSVTPTCFTVTYAKGRMCTLHRKSVNESCSITYPREVQVQRVSMVTLTCNSSCPQTGPRTVYSWYRNKELCVNTKDYTVTKSPDSLSCAVKLHEHMLTSCEVCVEDKNCWSVNYVDRRICALQGTSVNISSEYSHPNNEQPKSKLWYKIQRHSGEAAEELIEAVGRVKYQKNIKNHHILRIRNLRKNDSAEYTFRLQKDDGWKRSDFPGVTLVVTGLKVKLRPAEVAEGQRVTLTCSTSCPLPINTSYMWYLNSRHLTLPQGLNKHLVLDPVSSQHAGNYYCAVETDNKPITSTEKTLTVQSIREGSNINSAAAAGVIAALLVIIALAVFFWIRRKNRKPTQLPTTEATENNEQSNLGAPVYENMSAQPTEQDDLHYSRVHFTKTQTDPLYSTVQPHQPETNDHVAYAVVNFRRKVPK